jgi:hypothetical protein
MRAEPAPACQALKADGCQNFKSGNKKGAAWRLFQVDGGAEGDFTVGPQPLENKDFFSTDCCLWGSHFKQFG